MVRATPAIVPITAPTIHPVEQDDDDGGGSDTSEIRTKFNYVFFFQI